MNKLKGIFIRLTQKQHQILKERSERNNVSIAGLIRLILDDDMEGHA